MSNFASLAEIIDDPEEKMEAIEHANCERMHAKGFMRYAEKHGLNININLNGTYWRRIREKFLTYSNRRDLISCFIIQEVMLESFATSMYQDLGYALGGDAGELFLQISSEELEHMEHSYELLAAELEKHSESFIDNFEKLHYDIMTIIAEFTAEPDLAGHCGVCQGDCMKGSLHHLGLDAATMRGNALALYAEALDKIGIPGEKSLQWMMRLPA